MLCREHANRGLHAYDINGAHGLRTNHEQCMMCKVCCAKAVKKDRGLRATKAQNVLRRTMFHDQRVC